MKIKKFLRSSQYLLTAILFTFGIVAGNLLVGGRHASAAQITARALTLQGVGANGGSTPNVNANHQFTYTLPSVGNTNVGSIKFEYCTTQTGTCTGPSALDTTAVTLGTSTGAAFTSVVSVSANVAYVSRTSAAVTAGTAVTTQLLGIHNPDGADCYGGTPPPSLNCTFYVRITSYASTDTTGGSTDTGIVAASIAQPITLTGYMPESLVFCTGGSISTTGPGVPDCSTATSGSVSFPDFSPTATSFTTSQMAASTNAQSGYAITVNGATMTSGANTIAAIGGVGSTSNIGTPQFGLNLVDNTTPNVGSAITTTGGSVYAAEALSPFDTDGTFAFAAASLNNIADSTGQGTDAQIYTVAYIVNVPGSQPAGTYTTTLTYICTPTF